MSKSSFQVFIPFIEDKVTTDDIVRSFSDLSLGKVTYIDMHDKKRNTGNKHSLKLVSLAHSYAFLKVEPFAHTEAGRNFMKNLTQNINTHIMYDIDGTSHNWDVKPYLTPEERISRGYILAPIPSLTDEAIPSLDNSITNKLSEEISITNDSSASSYKKALLAKSVQAKSVQANSAQAISVQARIDNSSVEYLRKISTKELNEICANIGRPQPRKQKTVQISDAYTSEDLAKEYDELQQEIDALVALPEPDDLLTDEFWNNLTEKKQMEHDECPRLYSIWQDTIWTGYVIPSAIVV